MLSDAKIARPIFFETRSECSSAVANRRPMSTRRAFAHARPMPPFDSSASSVATKPPVVRLNSGGRTIRTTRSPGRCPRRSSRLSRPPRSSLNRASTSPESREERLLRSCLGGARPRDLDSGLVEEDRLTQTRRVRCRDRHDVSGRREHLRHHRAGTRNNERRSHDELIAASLDRRYLDRVAPSVLLALEGRNKDATSRSG